MKSNDFIVENGVLKAYVGPNNITEMEIPEGVESVSKDFLQQKLENEIKLTIPPSLKSFECNDLIINELIIPKDSLLENLSILSTTNEIVLPKTIKNVSIGSKDKKLKIIRFVSGTSLERISVFGVKYIIMPKMEVKEKGGYVDNVSLWTQVYYVFYEGSFGSKLNKIFSSTDNIFVYENQDIDKLEFIEKNGIEGFKTKNGFLITDIDNRIAKLEDLPTEFEGLPVCDYHIFDIWYYLSALKNNRFVDKKDSTEKAFNEKYGTLYPKISYRYKKVFNTISEAFLVSLEKDNQVKGKKSKTKTTTKVRQRNTNSKQKNKKPKGVLGKISLFFSKIFINKKSKSNNKKAIKNVKDIRPVEQPKETVATISERKSEPVRTVNSVLKTIPNYYTSAQLFLYKLKKQKESYDWDHAKIEREIASLRAEIADIAVNGTKEQQAKRAMGKKFSELSDAIRESKSNSPSSYDVFDDHGRKVGEINKKD